MKDAIQIEAIVDGIIDYLESIKSLDLLPHVSQKLLERSWIKLDPNLAQIYSRIRLNPEQMKTCRECLAKHFQRTIRVKNIIDQEIIAGIRIQVGGKTIDATVNRRLEDLKQSVLYD